MSASNSAPNRNQLIIVNVLSVPRSAEMAGGHFLSAVPNFIANFFRVTQPTYALVPVLLVLFLLPLGISL